jgi:hypothetical protein
MEWMIWSSSCDTPAIHLGPRHANELKRGLDADAAALAIQAAANGVIALLRGGASTQQIKSTSSLLFEAVLGRVLAN